MIIWPGQVANLLRDWPRYQHAHVFRCQLTEEPSHPRVYAEPLEHPGDTYRMVEHPMAFAVLHVVNGDLNRRMVMEFCGATAHWTGDREWRPHQGGLLDWLTRSLISDLESVCSCHP